MSRKHNFNRIIKLPPVDWKPGDLMTDAEIEAICNVKKGTAERWRIQGKIQFVVTPGGQYRYPREQFLRLLEPQQNKRGQQALTHATL